MLIPVFVFTVLIAATAALLWCLREFTRTLKQQRFVGVLVRTEDGSAKSQAPAQGKHTGAAENSPAAQSRRGILQSGQSMARTEINIQKYTSATLERGHRSHIVKDVA